mmetsp:Transcript_7112/g.11769  ORF Transcript_7112/g.11769 Transcript_7112/m.11769 type:complete len:365 (+) Transcript_7112:504-1598(+)
MIVDDVVEATVDTLVDVVSVDLSVAHNGAASREHIGNERARRVDHVASRLRNDADTTLRREELVERGGKLVGESREKSGITLGLKDVIRSRSLGGGASLSGHLPVAHRLTGEASTNIEDGESDSELLGNVKGTTSEVDGLGEGSDVLASAANVVADTNEVDLKINASLHQGVHGLDVSAKLDTKLANGTGIVREKTKKDLGLREVALDLVELVLVVEGHHLGTNLGGVEKVRLGLTGVGEDNVLRASAGCENHVDFALGGAVKANAKRHEATQNLRVVVAFYGVEGLNAGKQGTPSVHLAVNIVEVDDHERGVIFTRLDALLDAGPNMRREVTFHHDRRLADFTATAAAAAAAAFSSSRRRCLG